jgi:hypothetical protein
MPPNHDGLELDADMSFQRREWRVQRVGWVVWSLILGAGLAGALGPGLWSGAASTAADGSLTVTYDRFVHYHQPTQLVLALQPADESTGELQVAISQSLLDRLQIRSIEPEPDRMDLASDGMVLSYAPASGDPPFRVALDVEFDRMGSSQGSIALVGSAPAAVEQFIYP